jgi:hypothetical protein
VKFRLICATLLTVTVCGCTYVKTDVRALDLSDELAGERTYSLAQAPSQEADPGDQRSEVIVREELQKYGFVTAPVDRAHYLLLPSFETRLATIGTYSGDCKPDSDGCESDAVLPSFHLLGGSGYRHSLTLRFFDRTSGQQVYKVSATNLDRNADPFHATEYLVRSALARFAHGGREDWQVKFHTDDSGRVPSVVLVTPRER